MTFVSFPRDFVWGAATSAYQIEGGAREDGKGLSIWDVFCRQPGRIVTGETGDVACDHYHRWRTDVALMAGLGLRGYRFSISWPRVLPFGRGEPNEAGIGFYSRLVDALLEAGIEPCATLYHWDLPQALQDRGGWAWRDCAHAFADYAALVFESLGDRVQRWITHNEPGVTAMLGHRLGVLAPGIRDLASTARVVHHLHLSHGLAVRAFRAGRHRGQIGLANADTSLEPADDRPETAEALERARDLDTRLFHDPPYGRGYPASVVRLYESRGAPFPVHDGDLETIAEPTDFLGVNLYTRRRVLPDPSRSTGFRDARPVLPPTDMGYEAAPHALGDFVDFVSKEYDHPPIYVTENGMCDNTEPGPTRREVPDERRVELLRGMLAGLARAMQTGADVRGYYVWSLLDNFEWSLGTSRRFGLVWTDFATQERIPKQSAHFYADVIARGGFEA